MDTELAKYGIPGIALALIGVVALMFKSYAKLAGNHINHNTDALNNVARAVDNNTEALKDFKEEMRARK